MTIKFNGKVYRLCLDCAGRMVVTVETGPRTSRPADPAVAERVLAGFMLPPLRRTA